MTGIGTATVRNTILVVILILSAWPAACALTHEPRECTMDGLASFFESQEAAWDIVIGQLTKDTVSPEVEGGAPRPPLETWLSDTTRVRALAAMGIDSVCRRRIEGRPILFIEVCRPGDADSVSALGYAMRLDSSAGAQDPLPHTADAGDGSSTSPAYAFRHLKGSVHVFAMSW